MVSKIIHQIVLGQVSHERIERCLSSWWELESYGFNIIVWNEKKIDEFLQMEYPFAIEAYKTARNLAEASDIARYLIIYHYGGYYIDWDIELVDSEKFLLLHEEFDQGYFLVDPINGSISCEHFSGVKSSKCLLNIIESIVSIYKNGQREIMNTPHYSGPYRMRSVLKEDESITQVMLPIKSVFEYDYWEKDNINGRAPSKAMIHYWLHTWI